MTIALLEALTFGLARTADAAERAGHRLVLLTGDRSIYAHELATIAPGRVEVVDIDTTDIPACEAALRAIPDLAGLINSTDTWAIPGAETAARLGLPGPVPAVARLLRDKGAVRTLLHEANLSSAPAARVDDLARVTLPYPFIAKDSAGTSSRAVWLIRDDAERLAATREHRETPLKGHLIVEPYFTGPVYSAETLTWRGHTRLLAITSRALSPEPLRREESASLPTPHPDHADLEKWAAAVLAAAGHANGFAHTEFALTPSGPEVVEINPRIGGALIGEALCRSLNTNVYEAMVAIALDQPPALIDGDTPPVQGIAFALVYPSAPGTLKTWTGLDRLAAYPGSPEWYPTARPGAVITTLGDQRACTGIVLAHGPTAELAHHNAQAAAATVQAITE